MIWFALVAAALLIALPVVYMNEKRKRYGTPKADVAFMGMFGGCIGALLALLINLVVSVWAPMNFTVDDPISVETFTVAGKDHTLGKAAVEDSGDTVDAYYWFEGITTVALPADEVNIIESDGPAYVEYVHTDSKWIWLTIFDQGTTVNFYR